ncbi:MAG: hypothetical protein GY953_30275, partial [bacterium]|nr:hypothetical protein [bacterium]
MNLVSFVHFRESPSEAYEAPLRRFAITPPRAVYSNVSGSNIAISPNGKHIAFATTGAEGKLWIQDLDQRQARVIAGTEGAIGLFWSPDSEFIGFSTGGELKKVPVQGGPAIRLCQMPSARSISGGSWSPDGESIVFAAGFSGVLYEVPVRGGTPDPVILMESLEQTSGGPSAMRLNNPHFLPSAAGSRVVVFASGAWPFLTMMVQDLETGR